MSSANRLSEPGRPFRPNGVVDGARTAGLVRPRSHDRAGSIRVGIGGWTFAPWRGSFYPKGLPHAQELSYASRCVTSIEINGTFYRSQSPKTFAKWAREVPDGFVFSIKAPRAIVGHRELGQTGPQIERFLASGLTELGHRLGPILWQLAPTHKYEPSDLARFFDLLPQAVDGLPLRHALEVRHVSFETPDFISFMRQRNAAIVYAEHAVYPAIGDLTSDLVYARLQKGCDDEPVAYPEPALDAWAARFKAWANGDAPTDLRLVDPGGAVSRGPRDVFAYVIHEGKVRAPAAAEALITRIEAGSH